MTKLLSVLKSLFKGLFAVIKATIEFLVKGIATFLTGIAIIICGAIAAAMLVFMFLCAVTCLVGPLAIAYLWLRKYIYDPSLGFKGVIEPIMFVVGLITIAVKIRIHYKKCGEEKLNPLLKNLLSLKTAIETNAPQINVREKIDSLKADISYAGNIWRYRFNAFSDKYLSTCSSILVNEVTYDIKELVAVIDGVERKYRIMTNLSYGFDELLKMIAFTKDFMNLIKKLKGIIDKIGFTKKYLNNPAKVKQVSQATEIIA